MTANPIASMTSDTLIIAEASADELRLTIEHLHTRLAIARAEAESHLERIDAVERDAAVKASQRDTFERALAHEREAGRGLQAQVEASHTRALAAETARDAANAREMQADAERDAAVQARDMAEAARDAHADELRAIRDLVAPGNPQGTVVDAVRARMTKMGDYEDIAIQRATDAERERDNAYAEIAKLRAEVAKLRERPVLTMEALDKAMVPIVFGADGRAKIATIVLAALGPVTLPSPDRAEELARADYDARNNPGDFDRCRPEMRNLYIGSMRAALAKLSPAPAREAAPTLVAVSDEELAKAFETAAIPSVPYLDRITAGIRAVRAKLGAAEVAEERLARAVAAATPKSDPLDVRDLSRAIFANLRAATAKEHDRE